MQPLWADKWKNLRMTNSSWCGTGQIYTNLFKYITSYNAKISSNANILFPQINCTGHFLSKMSIKYGHFYLPSGSILRGSFFASRRMNWHLRAASFRSNSMGTMPVMVTFGLSSLNVSRMWLILIACGLSWPVNNTGKKNHNIIKLWRQIRLNLNHSAAVSGLRVFGPSCISGKLNRNKKKIHKIFKKYAETCFQGIKLKQKFMLVNY